MIGAIVWDLITWYFGLPSSSSHALIGGLIGSGLVAGGSKAIVLLGVQKTLTFMIISPMLGFVIAFAFAIAIMYFLHQARPSKVNKVFGKIQIASSAFFSLTHGANDGQKTMGVITALLIAGGFLRSESFAIPIPVILADCIGYRSWHLFWWMANCKNNGLQINQSKTISRVLC